MAPSINEECISHLCLFSSHMHGLGGWKLGAIVSFTKGITPDGIEGRTHFVSMVWEAENLVLLSLLPKGHLMGLGENPIYSIHICCISVSLSLSERHIFTLLHGNSYDGQTKFTQIGATFGWSVVFIHLTVMINPGNLQ